LRVSLGAFFLARSVGSPVLERVRAGPTGTGTQRPSGETEK